MNEAAKFIGFAVWMASLMLGYQDSLAQSNTYSIEEVNERFEHQVTNIHQEKTFIHLDRDSYITGETIWMSAYCVDASFHTPGDLSKVLNVELLDESHQAVKQIRIQLNGGFGQGQIFISPDILSGFYMIRAYTNWMKNFKEAFVFYKRIQIVNPSSVSNIRDSTTNLDNQTDIGFFPEGGNLIAGLKSKIAVKAVDSAGSGLAVTGIVYDNDDVEVAEFTTSEKGYTYFFLTPESTKSYFAMVKLDSAVIKYPIPKVEVQGISLSVNTSENGNLSISTEQTKNFLTNPYLVVHTRGVIKKILTIDLAKKQNINIKWNELPEGISHITLLNSDFTALAERLVFKYPDNSGPMNLDISHTEYGKRKKVDLTIALNERWNEGDSAHLSIAVSHSKAFSAHTDNIVSNLLLTSDLKGSISSPWTYFDPNNKSRAEQLDLVMLTNGWRRFDWETVKQDQKIRIKYPAEIRAPILSGRVYKNEQGNLPISLQMNFLGKASLMNSHNLDPEGFFHFEVPSRIDNEKVYFFVNRGNLLSDQISVSSPFDLASTDTRNFNNRYFASESREYLETLNTNIQISQVYRDYNHINGSPAVVEVINTPFYGTPDYLYNLDDYTRFETIEDVFLEYIRTAVIRDNNKMVGFYVLNNGFLSGSALTLIDGIPVFDTEYVKDFDPLKIEKISVVKSIYSMGSIDYHGIIDFTTYKGDFDEQELPKNIVEKVYHGLQHPRVFYSPDYSKNHDLLARIPDYRNTLYWNPQVKINGRENIKLQFFTADALGSYQIEVNGITNQGQPIFLQHSFEVKE